MTDIWRTVDTPAHYVRACLYLAVPALFTTGNLFNRPTVSGVQDFPREQMWVGKRQRRERYDDIEVVENGVGVFSSPAD